MKTKLLTILTLLVMAVTGAWSADFVDTYGNFGNPDGSTYAGLGISNVTLGDNTTASSGIQIASSKTGTFTVSVPDGFTIKSVVFTDNGKASSITCDDDPTNTLSRNSSTKVNTYTASSNKTSVIFTIISTSSSTKLTNLIVTTSSDISDDYEVIRPTGSASSTVIPFNSSLGESTLVSNFTTLTTNSKAGSSSNGTIDLAGNGAGVNIQTTRAIKAIYCVWFQRAPQEAAHFGGFTYVSATETGDAIGTYSYPSNKWTASDANTKAVALKRCTGSTAKLSAIHIFYYDALPEYDIIWNNGGQGTAPTSPTKGSIVTLPQMDAVEGYTHVGWKADQTVKVAGEDVAANTTIAIGAQATISQATTFTGVWKATSSLAVGSSEVEVAIDGTSQIVPTNAIGTVTYTSADESIATVSSTGLIEAVAGGKTTITVADAGNESTAAGSVTVTVLVPYPNPAVADSYVLNIPQYAFSNSTNTKYYFKNGFTISVSSGAECQYATLDDNTGIKYSHARQYTINVPTNVTVTYAAIKARNNYKNENDNAAANWGTVFGTSYSSDALPWSNETADEKDFVIESPSAGGTLVFQPGGNQWQAIINLYTIEYHEKFAVSYAAGAGTGTMTGSEVREGSTLTLPVSTFTEPNGMTFVGWVCSVDGETYAAGADYNMTGTATTFTAQYEGNRIINAKLTSNTAATVSGTIGGTATVSLQNSKDSSNGYKFGQNDNSIVLTLDGENTFQTGDIINVHATTAGESTLGNIAFFKGDKSTLVLNTGTYGVRGDNKFTLPEAVNGENAISLVRTDTYKWNGYVDYIEVIRPDVITLNPSGFGTYSRNKDFIIQSGATAYKLALDGTTLDATAVTAVPAAAGVLLKGETAAKVYIIEKTEAAALVGNDLKGTTQANGETVEMGDKYYYVLSGNTFKHYTGTSFTANKAYFETNSALSAKALTISFNDGETTSINALNVDENVQNSNSQMYNLAGQKVSESYKGIVIVNGRKFVRK